MLKEKNKLLRKFQLFVDMGITAGTFFIAYLFGTHIGVLFHPIGSHHYLILLYIILPLWGILLYYNDAYQSIRTKSFFQAAWPVLKTVSIGGGILLTILFIFQVDNITKNLVLLFLAVDVVFLVVERYCFFSLFHFTRKRGYNVRTLLIVGTGERARAFTETILSHKEWGLKIVGYIDIEPDMVGKVILGKRVMGLLRDIPDILTKYQVDEIVFVGPRRWLDQMEETILSCEEIGIKVRIACDFYPMKLSRIRFDTLADWPLLGVTPPPHYGDLYVIKKAMDILLSCTALLLTFPLLILIALGIKLTSSGPIFFKQERYGLNGRTFHLFKFRTMANYAEKIKPQIEHLNEMSGPVFKIHNDPRVTRFGKFLRKFSLDEFPQFVNVLKNDMSIVGPRPPIPDEVKKYDYNYRRRLSVQPGITCLWQVNGRNKTGFQEWMRLDLEYIDNWSLGLDMKIIIKTVLTVLKGAGV